jgi:hypothetical protein
VDFLKTDNGAWLADRRSIGSTFVSHFSSLFTSSGSPIKEEMLDLFEPSITVEENDVLCSIPAEEEIYEALVQSWLHQSTWPYGYTALFYKKFWPMVKFDVLNFVWSFFRDNHLLREQNHTFIALVPKISGPHSVHHFRPISLCNIVYKIITKILANRLKILLPKIISPLQSAFVPNRNIQDNTILAHELLNSFKNKKGRGGLMILKLDMEKAFDRMEWSFLLAIMGKLGFHPSWVNWIRICITSPSFSILLNGSPFGLVFPARGLRQGDPLSPFLFILGSEVFSRLLSKAEAAGSLKGMKIARHCSAISHLLFADDLLIFGRACNSEASCIKDCVEKYTRWSGQAINANKSSIHFSRNTLQSTANSVLEFLPYNPNPTRATHLGLPILFGLSKTEAFSSIFDKVRGRIEGWRAKSLSQAGRSTLIKSVAASIPTYAMSTFLLPKSFCSKLDRLFKNFWWGFPPQKAHNLSLKSWKSICLPRAAGGLGFRLMRDVNLSLIAKLGWRILTNSNNSWVSQLQCKYLHSCSFLSAPIPNSGSWVWKGILKSRSLLSQGFCYRIHKNCSLPIWDSPWIPSIPLFKPTPNPSLNSSRPPFTVRDLILPSSQWNVPLIQSIFDFPSTREILKLKIFPSVASDFFWAPSQNGTFSSHSAYSLASGNRAPIIHPVFDSSSWKLLWRLNLNARLSLLLWKIAWDILPTKSRLSSLFPISPSDMNCPLCHTENDSLSHLFFRCIFSRVVWRNSFWPLDSLAWSNLNIADWIKGILNPSIFFGIPKKDTHLFQVFAAVFCDLFWFSRNKAAHEGLIPDPLCLAASIKKVALDHARAWKVSSPAWIEKWAPPPIGSHTINFDTAIREHFSVQAAVCRNSNGKIISAVSQVNPPCVPIFGEALAARLAVTLASSLKLKSFILEGDSALVIMALQQPLIVQDWSIADIISDTLSIIPFSSSWKARKVNRSANFCAHHVAFWAAARSHAGSIPMFFPPHSSFPFEVD